MSKWIVVSALLCVGLTAACGGGGSGVSRSKRLVSLSDSEIMDLCEYLVGVVTEDRSVTCSGGVTFTIRAGTVAECAVEYKEPQEDSPDCAATVGDAEDCTKEFPDFSDQEICAGTLPASCQALFSCGGF